MIRIMTDRQIEREFEIRRDMADRERRIDERFDRIEKMVYELMNRLDRIERKRVTANTPESCDPAR